MESLQGSLVGAERRTEPDELEAGLNALIERRAANLEDRAAALDPGGGR